MDSRRFVAPSTFRKKRLADELIGRAGDLTLVSRSDTESVVALDHAQNRIAWESTDVSCSNCVASASGVSPDGSLCWVTDSARDDRLTAFDCRTGRPRFTRTSVDFAAFVPQPNPGLFVASPRRASPGASRFGA